MRKKARSKALSVLHLLSVFIASKWKRMAKILVPAFGTDADE
jgi:hypothetical protein